MKPNRHPLAVAALLLACLLGGHVARAQADDRDGGARAGAVLADRDVLDLMDRVPAAELARDQKPYPWHGVHDARRIAALIARVATSREQAAKLVVWGAFESGYSINAAGDCDPPVHGQLGTCHSFGWLQLSDKQIAPALARDPEVAVRTWLANSDRSQSDCGGLPEDERDAQLASGNCGAGRQLSARRARVVRALLAP
jgi:hypothetical protein